MRGIKRRFRGESFAIMVEIGGIAMFSLISGVLVSYLLGAIPFSYILGKCLKGIDIREHGSGNVGATNLMRSVGKVPGLIALFLDALKGFVAVTFVAAFFYKPGILPNIELFRIMLGFAAVAGHIWTIFLKFKGGKGVATAIGVFIGLAPLAMVFGVFVWGLTAIMFRYVSFSSIIMAVSLPVIMFILHTPKEYTLFACLLGVFIIYKHRTNISRLIKGTEYKIGQKVKSG